MPHLRIPGAKKILAVAVAVTATAGGLAAATETGPRLDRIHGPALGWDMNRLSKAFDFAATLSTDTLIVESSGQSIGVLGDPASVFHVHSVRKAILSTLVARHLGPSQGQIRQEATLQDLGIDDAPGPLTDLQKTATVLDLLHSASGINHPAAAEEGQEAEKTRRLGVGENRPGAIWAYNNWDYNALTTIFEQQTGRTIAQAFESDIARPLGMRDFTEASVSYIGAPELSRHRAAAFRLSGRDLLAFGRMFLDEEGSVAAGLLPAGWIARVFSEARETGNSGLSHRHGMLWWIPDDESGLPDGTFWAKGLGPQAVFVIPAWDTVIVHQIDMTAFLSRFIGRLRAGDAAEKAIEALALGCIAGAESGGEFCRDHRLILRREFAKLVRLIADARRP